jgi:hypothetical protein
MTSYHQKLRTEARALAESTIRRAWGWRNHPLKEFQRMLRSSKRARHELNHIAATIYVLLHENADLAQTVDDFNDAAQAHSDAAWALKQALEYVQHKEGCLIPCTCGLDAVLREAE